MHEIRVLSFSSLPSTITNQFRSKFKREEFGGRESKREWGKSFFCLFYLESFTECKRGKQFEREHERAKTFSFPPFLLYIRYLTGDKYSIKKNKWPRLKQARSTVKIYMGIVPPKKSMGIVE